VGKGCQFDIVVVQRIHVYPYFLVMQLSTILGFKFEVQRLT
jgi:hypothetical protein